MLNAIWNDENSEAISFTDVTYWGVNGKNVTNEVPELSNAEVWQNITVERLSTSGESISNATVITDGNGVFKYYFADDDDSKASFKFYHFEDKYYKALTDSASIKKSKVNISVADINFGDNATVKVNLTDWDGNKLSANVTIKINNTHNFTMEIINGVGEVNNVSGLIAGIHNATVIFKGNETILGSSNSTLFTVKPAVNIIINKTSDIVGNASVYDLANFTIVVTNYGPSNATGVNITDYLEEGLVYIDSGSNLSSVTKEKITLPNGTEVVKWTIGNLTKNTSVKLWVQVNLTRNGTFGNVAIVDSVEGGRNSSNVTNVTVDPVVNLTVVKVSNLTGNASVGDLVRFNITVTNRGPSNATGVNVTDSLPVGLVYISSGCNVTGIVGVNSTKDGKGSVFWDIGRINAGESVLVWVVVNVTTNGTFRNVAVVRSNENSTPSDNGTNISVDPVVNLNVNKTVNATNVIVGDLVKFTINVTNNGPSNATNVTVSDKLVEGFEFISNLNPGASYNDTTRVVTWTINRINVNESASVVLTVRVVKEGNFSNVAFAKSNENDTEVNGSSENVTAGTVILNVTKVGNASVVNVGDVVRFNITVNNTGSANATGVNVSDVLNSAFEFVNASGNVKANSSNVVVWNNLNIANGTSVTVWVEVRVKTNGTFTNVATAKANENSTPFVNETNITVKPVVNLTVVKVSNLTGNASVGDLVRFNITVTNYGPSNATGVNVTDSLPVGLVYVSSGCNVT
ncbi:MAG: DUF11 domain-containing protein, partial [Methanobrevibacter sp.]|nr:DUF11 domain-containing protein [Methanobrevibacter sp.]